MILFRWCFDRSPLRSRWRRFLRSPRIGITKRGHWGFEQSLEEWTHFSMAPCPWLSRNSANMAHTSAVNSICDCLFLPLLEDVLLWELDNLEMTVAILQNKSTCWWTIPKEEKKNRSHITSASGSWSLSSLSSFTTMEGGVKFPWVQVSCEERTCWFVLIFLSSPGFCIQPGRTQIHFLFRILISHRPLSLKI